MNTKTCYLTAGQTFTMRTMTEGEKTLHENTGILPLGGLELGKQKAPKRCFKAPRRGLEYHPLLGAST
jgi:hypothetical protein